MANLTPFPKFRAFDANGDPLAGGKLYSYEPGTSTPKATYTDQAAGTPNANPTILDANGEADVWLDGNYRLVLDDSADVEQWDVDNVTEFSVLINGTISPGVNDSGVMFDVQGTINEAASGTHALLAGVRIQPPTINAGAASVTETASLYISGAPSAAGATNYAMHVDADAAKFDGTVEVDGIVTMNTTVKITGSPALLEITDDVIGTDTGTRGAIHFGRTADLDLAVVGFKDTTSDFTIENNIESTSIVLDNLLTVTAGSFDFRGVAPQLSITDTNSAAGATTGTLNFRDSGDANVAHIRMLSGDVVVQNFNTDNNIVLQTTGTAGDINLLHGGGNVTVRVGTGAPAHSANNGSLYLRTDGAASTTLYVRAGGAWSALT